MSGTQMNKYPVTMYGVCRALDETETPLTVAEIIEASNFIDTPASRAEVLESCDELVKANLATIVNGNTPSYITTPSNTGAKLATEDNDSFYNALTELKVLTDLNDHNNAYIMGTELLNTMGAECEALLKKFKLVRELCEIDGYIDGDLNKYRYALYRQMVTIAENYLDEDKFNAFYDCF